MRSAMRMVREELGADAVILSNDRVNGGVEIVAAVDYDETILDRSPTSKQGGSQQEKSISNEIDKPQQQSAATPSAVPSKTIEPVAQPPRYEVRNEVRNEVRKQPPVAARQESNVRYDDFNGVLPEDEDPYLDTDNFGDDYNNGYAGEQYGREDYRGDACNQDQLNHSQLNHNQLNNNHSNNHINTQNFSNDDDYNAEFDADYSDDVYGNQHISLGLHSKIDSAFNPKHSRKESPYLQRQNAETSGDKIVRQNSNSLRKQPDNRESEKNIHNANNRASHKPQDKPVNRAASQPRVNNEFLSLEEIPPQETRVNDTLFDTNQVRDFPKGMGENRKTDGKESYSVWSQEPTLVAMRQEITTLRSMLEQQLTGLAWNDLKKNNPLRAKLVKQLLELGFSPELADQAIAATEGQTDYRRAWQMTLSALAEKLPVKDDDMVLNGGVVALVGATGVGKTTTIAKLAARYALRHGRNSVVLITTDTYRIGALEQLRTYGRILGIPVKIAHNKKQLKELLKLLGDKKFVLIDTAGMGQRDIRLMEQFSVISDCAKELKTLLVLSSTTHRAALDETVRTFSNVEINSCILSKLDETTNLGGALSVVAEHQLPVAYISDGQRVPEDLHLARAHTLINRCVTIARRANQSLDNDSLELAYSRMPSHVSA